MSASPSLGVVSNTLWFILGQLGANGILEDVASVFHRIGEGRTRRACCVNHCFPVEKVYLMLVFHS